MLAGCQREDEIVTYSAPKQRDKVVSSPLQAATVPVNPTASQPASDGAQPSPLKWTTPQGWTQLPGGGMRYASFQVDAAQPDLQLTIIPLGAESGSVEANVHRWENQLGLPPTPSEKMQQTAVPIVAGGAKGIRMDLAAPPGKEPPRRMLAAMLFHGDRVWYFKLIGPDAAVAAQRQRFDELLHSLEFVD